MRKICPECRGTGYVTAEEELAWRFLKEAAQDFDVTVAEIKGPWRATKVVEARRYVARELRSRGQTLEAIGKALGSRNHTTIINLLNGKAR